MRNARRGGRRGEKGRKEAARGNAELIAWANYVDSEVRRTVVHINYLFSLPPEHFEGAKFRLELEKLLGGDPWWPPPRPPRRLSSRSPSWDREEACAFPREKKNFGNTIGSWGNLEGVWRNQEMQAAAVLNSSAKTLRFRGALDTATPGSSTW